MRKCTHCGKPMSEGYYAGGDYYCSEDCLHTVYTDAEWLDLCDDGEADDFYYTEWELDDVEFDDFTIAEIEQFIKDEFYTEQDVIDYYNNDQWRDIP